MNSTEIQEHAYEIRALLDLYYKELSTNEKQFDIKAAKEHILTKIVELRRHIRRMEVEHEN